VASLHKSSLGTRIVQGVAIAFWLTLFWFVVRVGFARHWSLRTGALLLLTVGVAGAAGGGAYYVTDGLRERSGWSETIANLISLAAYFVVAFVLLAVVARWL
jgi:hypothetical protein